MNCWLAEDSLYRHYYALQFQWGEDDLRTAEEEPARARPAGDSWAEKNLSLFLAFGAQLSRTLTSPANRTGARDRRIGC